MLNLTVSIVSFDRSDLSQPQVPQEQPNLKIIQNSKSAFVNVD